MLWNIPFTFELCIFPCLVVAEDLQRLNLVKYTNWIHTTQHNYFTLKPFLLDQESVTLQTRLMLDCPRVVKSLTYMVVVHVYQTNPSCYTTKNGLGFFACLRRISCVSHGRLFLLLWVSLVMPDTCIYFLRVCSTFSSTIIDKQHWFRIIKNSTSKQIPRFMLETLHFLRACCVWLFKDICGYFCSKWNSRNKMIINHVPSYCFESF